MPVAPGEPNRRGLGPTTSNNEIGVVFRCWKDRVAYDENKYVAALAKRGSPLGKLVVVGTGAQLVKSLWILSEQRRLEVQKTLDTLTQTSGYTN